MRGIFLAAIVVGLVAGVAVAGVRLFTRDSSDAGQAGAPAAPEGSARAVAEQFAGRWSDGDFDGLYLLVAPEAQQTYPLTAFTGVYRQFTTEMTQSRLDVQVAETAGQVAKLAVHLETAYFGTLEYSTTLNLTRVAGRWMVNWDPASIHPDMAGGRAFRSLIEKPKRGAILDRNGQPLAVTRDVGMLGLNRSLVTDKAALKAAVVALGFSEAQLDAAFASTLGPSQRVPIGRVGDDRVEEVSRVVPALRGVILYFESQRVHPLGPAAAHVAGYTRELTREELEKRKGQGFRPGDRIGAFGLEAGLEDTLAGKTGAELRLVEADGSVVRVLQSRPLEPSRDVTTTLDSFVLRTAAARMGDRAGAVVVIAPATGAILAMISSPSFDPDAFERGDRVGIERITATPNAPQTNRATAGLYSAGSTFKLVTGAAGLAYGGYKPSDTIYCGATWNGIDPPRKNWEGTQGPLTIAEGLMRSCNTVFYEIALKLYNADEGGFQKMARAFGFGTATGLGVLPEEDGLLPGAAWKKQKKGEQWYPGDEVNLGIGQGDLLITPLQLANAYTAFVNLELRSPVLLAGQEAQPRGKIPLTAEQAAHLRLGLKLVTGPAGTASAAFANAGYADFAGKSGTAEDVGTQQHVLFVAYAPAGAPKAVAAVFLDEGQSGSVEAGPIARDVVLAAMR
jgi:penicillin-binding protein 2